MKYIKYLIVINIFLILFSCTTENYKINKKNGITYIFNKKKSDTKEFKYKIKLESVFFDKTKNLDHALSNIMSYAVDRKGYIYICDNENIKVFNEKGFFSHSFSRQGAGPGEFSNKLGHIAINKDTVIVGDNWSKKIIKYDKKGNFLSEIKKTQNDMPYHFISIGDKFVGRKGSYVYDKKLKKIVINNSIVLFDNNFKKIKTLLSTKKYYDSAAERKTKSSEEMLYYSHSDSLIYVARGEINKYNIYVYNFFGKLKFVINKRYTKKIYNKKKNIYYNSINALFVDNQQRLWVSSPILNQNNNLINFDIFENGIYRNSINIPNVHIPNIFNYGWYIKMINSKIYILDNKNLLISIYNIFIKEVE